VSVSPFRIGQPGRERLEGLLARACTGGQADSLQHRRSRKQDAARPQMGKHPLDDGFAAIRGPCRVRADPETGPPVGQPETPQGQVSLQLDRMFAASLIPLRVIPPDQFSAWPKERRAALQAEISVLEKELEHVVRQMPQWEKQRRDDIRALNRETAKYAVDHLIEEVRGAFADIPRVAEHIEAVRADLIENVPIFASRGEGGEGEPVEAARAAAFERYEVNVLVSQNGAQGAPLVEELHPTLGNLIGRIEYVSAHGVLITNFLLIKAGALHRASGGYLLLDLRALLMEPFSWTALKRALKRGEIAIEDRRPVSRPHQHGHARTGSDTARGQGGAVRGTAALFPALRL